MVNHISLLFLGLLVPLTTLAEDSLLKVGLSLPLTGPLAEYGIAVQNGINAALQKDSTITKRVQFLYEDNAYDSKKAVTSIQKLINLDGIHMAMVWGNEPALAVAPVVEARKIPTLAIAQYPKASVDRNYVIRFMNSGEQYSQTLLEYLRKQGVKDIALIKSDMSFFDMLIDGLRTHAQEETIRVIDSYQPSDLDFRPSILKLRKRKFDILGVYLISPQVRQFYRQAAELRLNMRSFGASPFESKSLLAESWRYMDGAIYTHNAVSEWFHKEYEVKHDNDMQIAYAANAFDFATLVASLFQETSSWSSADSIMRRLREAAPTRGASGPFRHVSSQDDGDHFEFDVVVKKIQNGVAKEVFRSAYGRT